MNESVTVSMEREIRAQLFENREILLLDEVALAAYVTVRKMCIAEGVPRNKLAKLLWE